MLPPNAQVRELHFHRSYAFRPPNANLIVQVQHDHPHQAPKASTPDALTHSDKRKPNTQSQRPQQTS